MRVERLVEVDAARGERVGQRDAVAGPSAARSSSWSRHRAGRGRRADQRAAEPGALLVGPVHEPDRDGRRALLRDPAQHLGARR